MYVVDIIPLVFLPRNQDQILTYFNKEPIEKGTIIEIVIGKRPVMGVVLGSYDIFSRKLNLRKSSDFQLKNVSRVFDDVNKVQDWQVKIAKFISSYYYAPLGLSLNTVLPSFWFKKKYPVVTSWELSIKKFEHQSYIITNLHDHAKDYFEKIKFRLKKKEQVFLMVAENSQAEYFKEKYKNFNPVTTSSRVGIKKQYQLWQDVASGKQLLVIGTRTGLFLPFSSLGLLIVDDEANGAYKSDMTPRYNAVNVAQYIANIHGAKIIFNSLVPRPESFAIFQSPLSETKNKNTILIDVKREIKDANFSVFSRDLKEAMFEASSKNLKIILHVPRRGHANFLACKNCGHAIKCPHCAVSMVYHKSSDVLMCHHCQFSSKIAKTCPTCKSYNLKFYGLGTSGVKEKLEKLILYDPRFANLKNKIFILDSDGAKNEKEERQTLEKFWESKPGVLITTQLLFSYSYLIKADMLGIINADALIHIPDFRSSEKMFRQMYTLARMADNVVIQTYNPEDKAIYYASRGDITQFLKEELQYRKNFDYPPFSRIIKLTFKDKDAKKARNEAIVLGQKISNLPEVIAKDVEVLPTFPAFISKERGLYIWNILLKTKIDFEIKKCNELLRHVPTGWIIDVDPKNLI